MPAIALVFAGLVTAAAVAKPNKLPGSETPDVGLDPGASTLPTEPSPPTLDPGNTPVAPCTEPSNCLQTDADEDGIPDMWEDKLSAKYAPELRLPPASEDWTRPANVDWYLARVHMRFEHGGCGDCEILKVGAPTQATLATQKHLYKNWSCNHKAGTQLSSRSEKFFLQPPDDAVHAGAPPSEWRTYVHVRRSDESGYEVQYWFFFAYNDAAASFNHEADWEHITVRTDAAGEFVSAWYAQHNTGRRYFPNVLTFVEGTHPVVYVADGSHASFPRAGTWDIPDVPAFSDHTYEGGPVWRTWNSWVPLGEKLRPRNGQEFVRYGGRWGEIGETSDTSGPRGPAFQGAWNSF